MIFLCRSGHFMQFLPKKYLALYLPLHPHDGGAINIFVFWQCRLLTLTVSIILSTGCCWKQSKCDFSTDKLSLTPYWVGFIRSMGKCYTYQHNTYHRWHQCCKLVPKIGGRTRVSWYSQEGWRTILTKVMKNVHASICLGGYGERPMDGEQCVWLP